MSAAAALNTAWLLKCAGPAWLFRRATRRVADVQARLLAGLLARNSDTDFGRAHGFRDIRDARDFQKRVPLSAYEDYAGAVARIAAGEANVLTAERVRLLEPTSGTTGGEKLVPYTDTLRRQFQRAVAPWVADLLWRRPAVRRGRAYWSISPALGPRRTAGGVPVGFEDDAAYLGALEQSALARLLVVPPGVSRQPGPESFRYETLLHLLRARDLALVSVWSPTFLTALLAPLEGWHERLCFDLARGASVPRLPRRAAELAAIFRSRLPWPEKLRVVWPGLALISCWADAAAARYLGEVRGLFPHVEIQAKGLLATEGCVSFPLLGRPAPVLAVRSHFFEFEPADGGECRLAHELEEGGRYRVVLTTGGGLYRYQLRDEVEVAGFENQAPLLRFLGKADRVSDLVGEKLGEPHVRAVLDRLFRAHGVAPRFALLVPVLARPARYRLYLQGPAEVGALLGTLRAGLEEGLRENPYYRQTVALGQLAPAEAHFLAPDGESAWGVYERRCLARGQKLGDVKPAALDAWTGWPDEFRALRQAAVAQRS
jgi:hypothetical protein